MVKNTKMKRKNIRKKTRKNKQKGGNINNTFLEVLYDSNKINGQLIKKEQGINKPKIMIKGEGYFTLIMRDPDAPGGNYLHWFVCNIKNNDLVTGTEVFSYYGPNPPRSHKHIHHYIFDLYKQKELIDCSLYEKNQRSSFDINGIVSKFGLILVDSKMFMVNPQN